MQLWITNHCKERYAERINNNIPVDVVVILKSITSGKDITNKVLEEAPRYLLYLYQKYNEFGLTIIKTDNIIYILKKKEGTFNTYTALTCYKDDNYLSQFKNTVMSRSEIYIRIKILKAEIKKNKK